MVNLSVIIPAYNEEALISKTIGDYLKFFRKQKLDFEINVILNGCTDNSLEVVSEISRKNKEVRFVDIRRSIGKGGAVIEGFKVAKGSLVCYVDADGSTSPVALNELIDKIGDNSGAMASRYLKESKILRKQPVTRVVASRGFNMLTRLMLGLNFKDTQCGGKVFRKEAINNIMNNLVVRGWAFDVNILYLLKKKGYSVIEVPTVWSDRKESKLKMHKAIPNMFFALLKIRFK